MRKHKSAVAREAWRQRWRPFVLGQWKHLSTEVLEAREARVLGLRLGLVSNVALSHRQIARRMHTSSTTIATLERRAIAKVTAALHLEGRP